MGCKVDPQADLRFDRNDPITIAEMIENRRETRTIYTVVLYIYGNRGAMPLEPGSGRYEALGPMARSRYGLCGRSGRCAQLAPRKLEQMGVSGSPQTPKTG